MGRLDRCYNIADLRAAAKPRLPRGLFDYIDRGTEDGLAMANNRNAFEQVKLRNRVCVDVTDVRLDTTLFGKPMSMPYAVSPTGLAGLCWHEGELALAKAATKAGVPCTLATGSITPLEKLAENTDGRLWYQLYMWRDRDLSYSMVKRARDAGFETLIMTVDTGLGGNREHNKRNGFGMPFRFSMKNVPDLMCHPGWVAGVIGRYVLSTGFPRHENYPDGWRKPIITRQAKGKAMRGEDMTWDDLDKIREMWPGNLVVKGILRPDDALRAVAKGADGIVVSNHGGRNMDSAAATLDVLSSVVEAVGDKTTVILDSGIRRGNDIVKALAYGAKAVMAGRPTLWGTAVAGEAGATHALDLIRNEFLQTMGYIGCARVADIGADVLAPPPSP
jgi:isopentenyl diphosphate isomerase/L-lactate dehydrogenase-like FMN-dependent dehydrogenase